MTDSSKNEGQYLKVDKLIHEPARLNLMAQLYVIESADFIFLMRQTGLTQGNLSAHLSKLETAQYIKVKKGFSGKRPQTMIAMTDKGRQSFQAYIRKMKVFFKGF